MLTSTFPTLLLGVMTVLIVSPLTLVEASPSAAIGGLLRPAQRYPFAGKNTAQGRRATGDDGCPIGWAECSYTTCYPLDGSQCCSDGNFCEAGTYCDVGGCCLDGEICDGSAPPVSTINVGTPTPTPTATFDPPPSTSKAATRITSTDVVTATLPASSPSPSSSSPFEPGTTSGSGAGSALDQSASATPSSPLAGSSGARQRFSSAGDVAGLSVSVTVMIFAAMFLL